MAFFVNLTGIGCEDSLALPCATADEAREKLHMLVSAAFEELDDDSLLARSRHNACMEAIDKAWTRCFFGEPLAFAYAGHVYSCAIANQPVQTRGTIAA